MANPNYRTDHGENIANQIQTDDAHGQFDSLTPADVWNILDNLHTHFIDNASGNNVKTGMLTRLSRWMRELENEYPNMEM